MLETIVSRHVRSVSSPSAFSLRGFAGESDYPVILGCINATKVVDGVDRSDTLEDIKRNYAHLHNCNPLTDMLFAEWEGETAGYCRVWYDINPQGEMIGSIIAFVKPAARRKGIGSAFLKFSDQRLLEIAGELRLAGKLAPDAPVFCDVFAQEIEQDRIALLQKNGFQAIRHFFRMVRPLSEPIPDASLPEGLEVRPALPEHYRQVWNADQEAFRDHWGYIPTSEVDYQNWTKSPEFQPHLWKVAWDGDQVAGCVLNFLLEGENTEYNRKRGYVEGISTRRPWRKRGLARALIVQSLYMFRGLGMEEGALGVDSQNLSGALRLYESVGFRVTDQSAAYRKVLSPGGSV